MYIPCRLKHEWNVHCTFTEKYVQLMPMGIFLKLKGHCTDFTHEDHTSSSTLSFVALLERV